MHGVSSARLPAAVETEAPYPIALTFHAKKGYLKTMIRVLVLLLLPLTATAQLLEPTEEHYAQAANQIALSRAATNLLALEVTLKVEADNRRAAVAMAAEARYLRGRLVEIWGEHIRRLRGGRGWPRPGDGWHEVHRGE